MMFLTSIIVVVFLFKTISSSTLFPEFQTTGNFSYGRICPNFGEIENGDVKIIQKGLNQFALLECHEGYDVDGTAYIYCINGKWEHLPRPECTKRCYPPPYLKNGTLEIKGKKNDDGLFGKGTLAVYSCKDGFQIKPKESKYRVCEEGIWTGAYAYCEAIKKITSCPHPKEIVNGYFVHEKNEEYDEFSVGQRLHYSCKKDYVLIGTPVQQCLDDGTWSPKIQPICALPNSDDLNDDVCATLPMVPHSHSIVVQGYQSEYLISGTEVQIYCNSKFRNSLAQCQPGKLRCVGGKWEGIPPICVPVHDCDPPPAVSYAVIYHLNPASYGTSDKYPIKSKVSYQCLPGYTLQGNVEFSCTSGGCWFPLEPPTCYRATNNFFLEVNSGNAILISIATGAGVLGLLLVICLITVCRRRKPITRAVSIAAPVPRADMGDHVTLLHHPDRLALIAFADGMQNDQSALPTYDEATRDRAPNQQTCTRLQRPHWPNLGGRRPRTTPNADVVHVTRHGSFASHTPSTRSAADSMGSTDTVAVSEGSTNITLDTASSHSGSQPASCRVHCGSLASFDTSSVVNTEGVPLLEESELEELQCGDTVSLVVDNPSISDNASFKLSTHSAEFS